MTSKKSRRDVLKVGGGTVVGSVLLAGCVGGGGDSGNGDSGNGGSGNGDSGNGDSGNGGSSDGSSDGQSDDGSGTTGNGSSGESVQILAGSKNFTENNILGYMSYEVLRENTNAEVVDKMDFGTSGEVWKAVRNEELDTHWDYTGTLWLFVEPTEDEPVLESQQAQYEKAATKIENNYDLDVLDMTPFQNTFGFMAKPSVVNKQGIKTISDLAEYVNNGNYDIKITLEKDFLDRNDGWPQLKKHYGFEEDDVKAWKENGGIVPVDVGLTYDTVNRGTAQVGLAYTTNANINKYGFELLKDDKSFWPYYNLTPVIRESKATEKMKTELNKIPNALESAKQMQGINAQVTVDGKDPQAVARSFLSENNII